MASVVGSPPDSDNTDEINDLIEAQSRSKLAWQRVWLHITSIDPIDLVRLLLVIGALVAALWLIWISWTALLPFQIGIVLAYIMAPIVQRLQSYMPRWTAILIVILTFLLILFLVVAYVVPPLVDQLTSLLQLLPNSTQLQQGLQAFGDYLETLPEDARIAIEESIADALAGLQNNVVDYISGVINFAINAVLSIVNTFAFLLGFVVIPFWLYFVLADLDAGKKALNQLLPRWLRTDFWAVLSIINRVIGSYFRGQLILGTIIFVAVFIGLYILEWAGFEGIRFKLLLAFFAGFMELIPFIGPILGAVPAIIVGLFHSWQTALAIALLFLLIQQVEGNLLVPRVVGDSVNIHPAIVMMLVIVLAPLGLLWLIIAVPAVAIIRDVYLYTYGRLSKPPLPAGQLTQPSVSQPTTDSIKPPPSESQDVVIDPKQQQPEGSTD